MKTNTEPLKVGEECREAFDVSGFVTKIFNLGQTYWQQADSESFTQQRKSDETFSKFKSMRDEIQAAWNRRTAPSPAEVSSEGVKDVES